MLCKAALISNFFQTICFLLQFHADYINQKNKLEQPTASLGWLSHATLPSSLSAPSTSVQPLKTENLRTEVPNPQQMLLLASTMSFCWSCSKRTPLEGEIPWKSRGNLSMLGNHNHLASIITIDTVREEGEGAVSNGLGTWNKSACHWDGGCSCTLTLAGAKLGAVNWLLALTVILMSVRCQLMTSNRWLIV